MPIQSLFSYLTDIHIESVTHLAPESFGHVIVKEQFVKTYHQENYCDIAGKKEQVTRIGADATEIISLESSNISTELSSKIIDEHLTKNMRKQSSPESSTDQEISSKENQDTSSLQSFGLIGNFEQDANHTLCLIRKGQLLVDKNLMLDKENDHQNQLLAVGKPVMDCYSNSQNESENVASVKEEAHSAEEKNGSINKSYEGLPCTEDTAGDTQLRASVKSGSTADPISCTKNSTSKKDVYPDNVVDTSLSVELPVYLENGVSETTCNKNPPLSPDVLNFDISPQSCFSQLHCSSETSCTKVPPLLGSRGMVHSVSLESEEELNIDSLESSHSQTSPPCRTSTESLPTFNSQRPTNLLNARERSFSPWNTSNMSSQRYFKEFFLFLVRKIPP